MTGRIVFIGGGQMAGSLIGGLLAANHAPGSIGVAEPDASRRAVLQRDFGVDVSEPSSEVAAGAAAVVLAVKPQVLREAVQALALPKSCTVISIAAGIRIDSLRRWLRQPVALVRCMPNTPALLGVGVSALYAPPLTPPASRTLAESVLSAVGATCWIPEEDQLDAVTALSGSGPAYFFLLTEALRDAGRALGLDAETASLLAQKTLAGAGRMAETGRDVAELRAQVTSRGGTTAAALSHFEAQGFRALVQAAVTAAAHRSRELGTELANT